MAIEPGTYNFTLQRRSDHDIDLVFKDSTNSAIDLTGFTVAAQVWEETRSTKFADFAVSYTNRSNGQIKLSLTDSQTATFYLDKLNYDVLLTNGSGKKEYYLQGTISVSEGYTE